MYNKDGNTYTPMDNGQFVDNIPVGVYTISDTMRGLVLTRVNDFEMPARLYGNIEAQSARVLNTYMQRSQSTGVLLAGEPGSGKTMLGRHIAIQARALGVITIIVNEAMHGNQFNTFIMSIKQPAIIFFDEFEKIYDCYDQDFILTLMDGVCNSKKLYIITCNDVERISEHMLNRPGRLYYAFKFGGLEKAFIIEYCNDQLRDVSQLPGVLEVVDANNGFSFDMLKALVEEMNRYDEPADVAVRYLNIGNLDEVYDADNSIAGD